MKQKAKRFYYQMKCWWMFKHHMQSIGKWGDKQLYQCSFCFKQIVVVPYGHDRGAVMAKAGVGKPTVNNAVNPIGSKHR